VKALAANEIRLDAVIELVVDEPTAIKRLLARRVHQPSGRIYNLETRPPRNAGLDDVALCSLSALHPSSLCCAVAMMLAAYTERAHSSCALSPSHPPSGHRRGAGTVRRRPHYRGHQRPSPLLRHARQRRAHPAQGEPGCQASSFPTESVLPSHTSPLPRSLHPKELSLPYFEVDANPPLEVVQDDIGQLAARIRNEPPEWSLPGPALVSSAGPDAEEADNTLALGGRSQGPSRSADVLQRIKLLARSSKLASRFPGRRAAALTAQNIKQLNDDDYRIAPKLVGERQLLALLDERLYLIDRCMRVRLFLSAHFPPQCNNTLLDGRLVPVHLRPTTEQDEKEELPRSRSCSRSPSPSSLSTTADSGTRGEKQQAHRHLQVPQGDRPSVLIGGDEEATERWYFVISDVLCAGGKHVCHVPLHERLREGRSVIHMVEQAPFTLVFQEYFTLDHIPTLLACQRRRQTYIADISSESGSIVNKLPACGLLFVPVFLSYRSSSLLSLPSFLPLAAYLAWLMQQAWAL